MAVAIDLILSLLLGIVGFHSLRRRQYTWATLFAVLAVVHLYFLLIGK